MILEMSSTLIYDVNTLGTTVMIVIYDCHMLIIQAPGFHLGVVS